MTIQQRESKVPKHLWTFGKERVVTIKMGKDIKANTFLGYARDHTGDTYRIQNDKTGNVMIARDVVWTDGKGKNNGSNNQNGNDDDILVESETTQQNETTCRGREQRRQK